METLKIKRDNQKTMVIHTKKKPRIHVRGKQRTKVRGKNSIVPVKEEAASKKEGKGKFGRGHIEAALISGKARRKADGSYSGGENTSGEKYPGNSRNSLNRQKKQQERKTSNKISEGISGNFERGRKENNYGRTYCPSVKEGEAGKRKSGIYTYALVGNVGKNTLRRQEEEKEEMCGSCQTEDILVKLGGAAWLGENLYRRQSAQKRDEKKKKAATGAGGGNGRSVWSPQEKNSGREREEETTDAENGIASKIAWHTAARKYGKKIKKWQKENAKNRIKAVNPDRKKAEKNKFAMLPGKAIEQKRGGGEVQISAKSRIRQFTVVKIRQKGKRSGTAVAFGDAMAKRAVKCLSLFGGGIFLLAALLALPVIAMVMVIYNSPFAAFFPSISSGETTQEVLTAYMGEFYRQVETEMGRTAGYDRVEKVYVGYGGEGVPDNYCDILAVYMVKHGDGDTATDMTEKARQNLKKVFDDMCRYHVTAGTETETDEDGNLVTYKVKYVYVNLKTAKDMYSIYDFCKEEQEIIAELMKPEYFAMMGHEGIGAGQEINPEQYQEVIDAISDVNGKKAVEFALSKVGFPYSQALRDSGTHFDCSSLAYYAWRHAGVSISYHGSTTAAYEGQLCYDNNWLVNVGEMQPGDLIFYSYEKNGRFMDISHVAIYAGNGMAVEAANARLGVVYRPVQSRSSIVMVGRPR